MANHNLPSMAVSLRITSMAANHKFLLLFALGLEAPRRRPIGRRQGSIGRRQGPIGRRQAVQ